MVFSISVLATSCAGFPNAPEVDFCALFSKEMAECNPSSGVGEIYDLPVSEMLGYQCVSPDHFSELKQYANTLRSELEECREGR